MARFTPGAAGVAAELDRDEAALLRSLVDEMRLLLDADIPPDDAVVRRLFPQPYEDDHEAAQYAELVGDDLKEMKRSALRQVRERLGARGAMKDDIPADEVERWLALLTDLRLAIGQRLGVTEEMMEHDIDPAHPDAAAWSVLHWLGWVQQSLLEAVDTDPQR